MITKITGFRYNIPIIIARRHIGKPRKFMNLNTPVVVIHFISSNPASADSKTFAK